MWFSSQTETICPILLRATLLIAWAQNECPDVSFQIAFSVGLPKEKSLDCTGRGEKLFNIYEGARCSGHFTSHRIRHGPYPLINLHSNYEHQAINTTSSPSTSLLYDPAERAFYVKAPSSRQAQLLQFLYSTS
jgi:hypothetical protein